MIEEIKKDVFNELRREIDHYRKVEQNFYDLGDYENSDTCLKILKVLEDLQINLYRVLEWNNQE